jgi:NAD(P)-dependent dehydrogenase (short-subunit alcohol dehydrogenase family)
VTGASSGLGAATARRLAKAGASVALLALVALVPLLGAAQAQTPKDLIAALLVKWNEQTPPFKMIGNVYYVGTDQGV